MATREQKQWKHHAENKLTRQIRKQVNEPRKSDRVRHREWVSELADDPDAFYDIDLPDSERVMPPGERERRQKNVARAMKRVVDERDLPHPAPEPVPTQQAGTVFEVGSGLCRVKAGDRVVLCEIRNSMMAQDTGYTNVVAVGDQVLISTNGHERGTLEEVLPRRSVLARPDVYYSHLQQILVANVDQLLIVASWREPALWPELLDRYLISAARTNLLPVICVNKVDLAEHPADPRNALRPYAAIGYRVLFTSAQTGLGLEELKLVLAGKTTALGGLSGVGKSSLLAAIQPDLHLRTADVSDRRHEGRHTTTQASLHPLTGGGFVVDTPGIREFGLSGLARAGLQRFYPEIAALAAECRFANCSHTGEAGCAVRSAVNQRRVSAMRYDSYQKIYRSLGG